MGNNKDNFYKENNGASNPEEEDMTVARDEEARAEEVQEGAEVEQAETEDELTILEKKVVDLEAQVEKEKKEYLFLMADFDNFRKRTLREKSELIKNGGESVLKGILPIMDDFERAIKASETSDDSEAMKEGMNLIYQKLQKFLQQNGVKEMDPADDTFDTEKHEAISVVPVPDEDKKGKILDTVQKGYTINDKVLRHAKVVVAQ
ncbi:MAG: nucleotide exchange factor GrpE [Muribaculaceae bacterium]|nr:nucleotide exchange factor GrpE [Muribaculaceae bacterium]